MKKTTVIIGAGPAGITAAFELARHTDHNVIVLEADHVIGGLSRTVEFNGSKLDIGGHRFFSKSKRINQWWNEILPLETEVGEDSEHSDNVMLVRKRLSRILFLGKLFSYPIKLNSHTFYNLGLWRTFKIGMSYLRIRLFDKKEIRTLEDLFIHRFGRELYQTFFKSYTEKVWGVPCTKIKPEWGSQRIKNLSVAKTILYALKENFLSLSGHYHKNQETSLIATFTYPKFGPGQLWLVAAHEVAEAGGSIETDRKVKAVKSLPDNRFEVSSVDSHGRTIRHECDYLISSMPLQDLIGALEPAVPENVKRVAEGLVYRDFIIVGLNYKTSKRKLEDQWIYIQEPHIKMGRLQIFNNWSPSLSKDPDKTWLGAEYFCNEGDELWTLSDAEMLDLARKELVATGFVEDGDYIDGVVVRQEKAYPAYFGSYDQFDEIQTFLERFPTLLPVGRNGMHRYNNMDHSMMTAMMAVENIVQGQTDKSNIWLVNSQDELHEDQ